KVALAVVASHAYPRVERDGAQERDAHLLGQGLATAGARAEDVALAAALGADKAAHVLGQAQDPDARLAAKVNLLADVQQGDFLWCRYHDGAVDTALLEEGVDAEVLVAGAGRGVDEQEVEVAPLDVLEELLDEAVLLGAAPDD